MRARRRNMSAVADGSGDGGDGMGCAGTVGARNRGSLPDSSADRRGLLSLTSRSGLPRIVVSRSQDYDINTDTDTNNNDVMY